MPFGIFPRFAVGVVEGSLYKLPVGIGHYAAVAEEVGDVVVRFYGEVEISAVEACHRQPAVVEYAAIVCFCVKRERWRRQCKYIPNHNSIMEVV